MRLKSALFAVVLFVTGDLLVKGQALDGPSEAETRAAVAKALPLLESGGKTSMEKRKQCFTCHNQGLPVMALTTARQHGFAVSAADLQEMLRFTAGFLDRNRTNYLAGQGQGGAALTAGYALWTLENGGWAADPTTTAVTEYLLLWQRQLDHWKPQTIRPPTEESLFAISYVALRGLKTFGSAEQKERIAKRTAQVLEWLAKTAPQNTEDRVFRLRALQIGGAAAGEIAAARQELLGTQRDDGGWSQLADMQSDAYATSTALTALHQAGGLPTSDAAYRRGLRWLLGAQLGDGSWHVRTRSQPIQTYYESGYPHGEDQFISITAAGWATTALALALPKSQAPAPALAAGSQAP